MERVDVPVVNDVPIPTINSVEGWKEIEIRECGEPLALLNERAPNLITVDSQYYARGIKHASTNLYARQGTANRLVIAASLLPPNHKLLIWDAWRPLEVQQALFDSYLEKLQAQNSNQPLEDLKEEAQTYVSLPSVEPRKPSPHYTGGAVDLTILSPNFLPIDMGTEFDHFGPEASARYYEDKLLNPGEEIIKNNRRLLYHSMTNAGFSSYDEEWWHFDFGNQFHSARTNETAIYGPANSND